MRVLFDLMPEFDSVQIRTLHPSDLLKSETYAESLCGFFNWFLLLMERRYNENPR